MMACARPGAGGRSALVDMSRLSLRRLRLSKARATRPAWLGRWARAASPADGERQPRSGEGVLPFPAHGGADASRRQHDGTWANDRHARRVLAVPWSAPLGPDR